jgi:hypothetical protein
MASFKEPFDSFFSGYALSESRSMASSNEASVILAGSEGAL